MKKINNICIKIVGDFIENVNIIQLEQTSKRYSEVFQYKEKGLDVLKQTIRSFCYDLLTDKSTWNLDIDIDEEVINNYNKRKIINFWSTQKNDLDKNPIWRIEKELGILPLKGKDDPDITKKKKLTIHNKTILIINDQDYNEDIDPKKRNKFHEIISDTITKSKKPTVILKTTFSESQKNLFTTLGLLKKRNLIDRYCIILDSNMLRKRDVYIPKDLSWNLIIEHLESLRKKGFFNITFLNFSDIFIYFKGVGVTIFNDNLKNNIKLVYDSTNINESWYNSRPGKTYGDLTILTGSVLRYILDQNSYPLEEAISNTLTINRINHDFGTRKLTQSMKKGEFINPLHYFIKKTCFKELYQDFSDNLDIILHNENYILSEPTEESRNLVKEYLSKTEITKHKFFSDENVLDFQFLRNYLKDKNAINKEDFIRIAEQIVKEGIDSVLEVTPRIKYGKFITIDREEIEDINEIRNQMISYCSDYKISNPLSIGIFGCPGSGKSFIIKELAKDIKTNQNNCKIQLNEKIYEFNLSQFDNINDLENSFHDIRDASVEGTIPVVIWDEFDTNRFKWLKEFLQPMQDGIFSYKTKIHKFGKSIFFFSGGICDHFENFPSQTDLKKGEIVSLKIPDFKSRLRCSLNVKSVNPKNKKKITLNTDKAKNKFFLSSFLENMHPTLNENYNKTTISQYSYIIKRGITLRSLLENRYPNLIDNCNKANISTNIVQGLLKVQKFEFETRSIEAFLYMCNLSEVSFFNISNLPSIKTLGTHLSEDFFEHITDSIGS